METSLDEDACEQSRCRARRVYHPAGEKHRWAEDKVATETDYLTASLGAYKGAAPSGALPMDRYRGHRIRCKAALRSNMPNDKGREVMICFAAHARLVRPPCSLVRLPPMLLAFLCRGVFCRDVSHTWNHRGGWRIFDRRNLFAFQEKGQKQRSKSGHTPEAVLTSSRPSRP